MGLLAKEDPSSEKGIAEILLNFSTEKLIFDNIPLYSESRKVIFLTNTSTEHVVSFRWQLESTESIITIQPVFGELQPNEKIACKVKSFSKGKPSKHEFQISCKITDETLMRKFEDDLRIWEVKQEELKQLFTIRDVPEILFNKGLSDSSSKKSKMKTTSFKYDTLPPINNSKKKRVIIEERPSNIGEDKPIPPSSMWKTLEVFVETHYIRNFEENYPDRFYSYFIQKHSFQSQERTSTKPATRDELNIVKDVLQMLIKDQLIDKNFFHSLDEMKHEPIPYFETFRCTTETNEIALISKQLLTDRQNLKQNNELCHVIEEVVENTLYNILCEVSYDGVSLTSRPRWLISRKNVRSPENNDESS